jgi:hypothetical protein
MRLFFSAKIGRPPKDDKSKSPTKKPSIIDVKSPRSVSETLQHMHEMTQLPRSEKEIYVVYRTFHTESDSPGLHVSSLRSTGVGATEVILKTEEHDQQQPPAPEHYTNDAVRDLAQYPQLNNMIRKQEPFSIQIFGDFSQRAAHVLGDHIEIWHRRVSG